MGHYILLMTLTPEGRERLLRNPDAVVESANDIRIPDVTGLGLYAVLGEYDFVNLVEAPDNDAVARYALELGVRAGVHTATLPAVPVAQLQSFMDAPDFDRAAAEVEPPVSRPEPPGSWPSLGRE